MFVRLVLVLMLLMQFCISPFADDDVKISYDQEIQNVIELGELILEFDNSAWTATDSLVSNESFFAKTKSQLRGWITIPSSTGLRTVFVGIIDEEFKAFAEFSTVGRETLNRELFELGRALTDEESLYWRVRQTTIEQVGSKCAAFPDINTIVLPIPNNDQARFYGYTFSSSKKWDEIVLGLHFRHLISADGKTVLSSKSFSNTCFAVTAQGFSEDAKAVGAMATYLKGPHPEEHHVFASLSRNIPIYVSTTQNNRIWEVNGSKVREVVAESD